jgi:hypothetical protein
VCQVRKNARSPSKAMLTGVATGVPSRRYVVSRMVLVCRSESSVLAIVSPFLFRKEDETATSPCDNPRGGAGAKRYIDPAR